jgi:5-(carboxyamino)imidazole ribonucleotide mutase
MGSQSDWPTLRAASEILDALAVPHKEAAGRGIKVIIAAAGGAAHLPGMTAAMTTLPVLGVPVESKALKGMDSLLSIVQMPGGVPVATFAIGEAGAKNAALHAAAILALSDAALAKRLAAWRENQTRAVAEEPSDT